MPCSHARLHKPKREVACCAARSGAGLPRHTCRTANKWCPSAIAPPLLFSLTPPSPLSTGWQPAPAAGWWRGTARMEQSTSGLQVKDPSRCGVCPPAPTSPAERNSVAAVPWLGSSFAHRSTRTAVCCSCVLPCADLSEVVTRVGLAETELDLVDSLGVSPVEAAVERVAAVQLGVAVACVHAAMPGAGWQRGRAAAHHPGMMSAAGCQPLLAPRQSLLCFRVIPTAMGCTALLPPARRRRCQTRCPTSWCGAAAMPSCCFGR